MAKIHQTAARGFSRGAADYERGRPGYPQAAVDVLARELEIDQSSRVVDLAAGTGKLTRVLLPTGADLVAVEPVKQMREQLESSLPQARVLEGTAEAMPLESETVDAVLVGQAFHWFEASAAVREIHRVLRPRGGLGLIWNVRDRSIDWIEALYEIIDRYRGHLPHGSEGGWRQQFQEGELFESLRQETFSHEQELDLEAVVAQMASISYISALPDDERRAVLSEFGSILDTHPQTRGRRRLMMPFHTEVFWTRKR